MREPPEIPGIESESVPSGRVYEVYGRMRLACYRVADSSTLRLARGGFYLYAFVEKGRPGSWQWTWEFADVEHAVRLMREILDPTSAMPRDLAPGGEPAMIHPVHAREFHFTRGGQPIYDARIEDELGAALTEGGEDT